MTYTARFLRWLWRAWPVLCAFATVAVHLLVLVTLPFPASSINKVSGTILQVLGGLIVLHSIDGNLGLFKQQGLLSALKGWLADFPKRNIVISASIGTVNATGQGATLSASAYIVGKTIEERLTVLERRLDEADRRITQQRVELLGRIDTINTDLSNAISATRSELRDLSSKVVESTVGGFKQQLFGVLLAIYGAVVSAFA
ncbi:hypothetical protein [Rubrivivax sp. A210]|uniref:hypothetical protein n=1 Tax=Rubrivivax sp. A210 TaxID=2772301 RepID=UPI00191AD0CE|nr:hypothetical protein [Rubrivivax sp. A210]